MTASSLLLILCCAFARPSSGVIVSTTSFRGEDCRRCHEAIRDRKPGPLDAKAEPVDAGAFDAVVVGGGLSGLTAAYTLKDLRVLVLDKEGKAGGKIRRESFEGHPYPVAGVYMGKPTGRIQKLFKSLGLKVERVTLPEHTLADGGKVVYNWITEDPSELPYSKTGQESIRKMQAFLGKFASSSGIDVPLEYVKPEQIDKYERSTFSQYIDNEFGPEAARLADLYARDMFGVSGAQVSATAGLMYFSAELEPSYTWEGGLGVATEALSEALGPAVSTGSFVWNVSQDEKGASVDFRREGRDYRARARAVIVAVPSLVARRIVSGLSDEKKDAMAKVRYSSYLLAPMRMSKIVWDKSFVYWTPGRFFTDLTLPVPSAPGTQAEDQVLVAYAPLGESEGRRLLLNSSDEDLANKVLSDLDAVFPGSPAKVAEARIIRWGHAMPILYPGYLTTVRPILAKPQGRYFFAGVDTQIPAFEGAAYSGILAAEAARRYLDASPDK